MFYVQFQVLVIIVTLVTINGYDDPGLRYRGKRRGADGARLNDHTQENKEELRRIIEMLNGYFQDDREERDPESTELRVNAAGLDDDRDDVVEEQVDRLKGLLGPLQRSYDNHITKDLDDPRNSRIHVIANPEVLEEFKRRVRAKHQSTSSDDSDANLSESLTYYKMNGNDRNNNHELISDEDNVSSDGDSYSVIPPSRANVIVVMRKSLFGMPRKVKHDIVTRSGEVYEGSKISWGQVEASHEKFENKKPEIGFDPDVDMPKNHVKKLLKYSDADEAPRLNRKPLMKKIRDEGPKNSERWSKVKINNPKSDEAKWDEPIPQKSKWDELKPQKSKWDDPKPQKSKWDEPKPQKSKWDELKPQKSQWDELKPQKSKWDEPKPQKSKWDEPRHLKSKWDEPRPLKSKWDEPRPQKSKWDEPRPQKSSWDQPRPKKSSWDQPRPQKSSWDQPKPQKSSWDQPRPQKSSWDSPHWKEPMKRPKGREGGGRYTPIPFIGKQRIYDDNK